jgi:hypothetical protein
MAMNAGLRGPSRYSIAYLGVAGPTKTAGDLGDTATI